MKHGFFLRLAVTGIRKNRQLYLPYLLASSGTVMTFYILASLARSAAIGETSAAVISLGQWVIGIFAVIFLFYTHSFLLRRRTREFGLYNVLGMEKRHIYRVEAWETVLTGACSLLLGLALGILLSKLAELLMLCVLQRQADFRFTVSLFSVCLTAAVFAAVYLFLLLRAVWRIHRSDPLALLRSENVGEKPPRANYLVAVLGLVLLAAAYVIAVSIRQPIEAMTYFFVAVVLVILATYLLFVAGSVALCRALQKNKRYYYRADHFVSVSNMAYRMKRNGAGLASICILCTMVLVMVSSTTSLYTGAEDSLHSRYPYDYNFELQCSTADLTAENADIVRSVTEKYLNELGQVTSQVDYRYQSVSGVLEDGNRLFWDFSAYKKAYSMGSVYSVYFIPLSDYNRFSGERRTLGENEVLLYRLHGKYTADTFTLEGGPTLHVVQTLSAMPCAGDAAATVNPTLYFIIRDLTDLPDLRPANSETDAYYSRWVMGANVTASAGRQLREEMICNELGRRLEGSMSYEMFRVDTLQQNRESFYGLYGSLFVLGIILSLVFLCAAVLIVYYKQVCEGYEDQKRFEIMQKVGMTDRDIRRSINAQMRTVFFAPLLLAACHLAFACPMVWRMLMLFNLNNLPVFLLTTACTFGVFAVFYLVVYRLTSGTYYRIVRR